MRDTLLGMWEISLLDCRSILDGFSKRRRAMKCMYGGTNIAQVQLERELVDIVRLFAGTALYGCAVDLLLPPRMRPYSCELGLPASRLLCLPVSCYYAIVFVGCMANPGFEDDLCLDHTNELQYRGAGL